jgi:hypothetical protein
MPSLNRHATLPDAISHPTLQSRCASAADLTPRYRTGRFVGGAETARGAGGCGGFRDILT